jgi:hypothetical protein
MRDVVYREDRQHAYTGTGAQIMATLRNLALGLLRLAGITQITRTVQHIAADRTRILPIIPAATAQTDFEIPLSRAQGKQSAGRRPQAG